MLTGGAGPHGPCGMGELRWEWSWDLSNCLCPSPGVGAQAAAAKAAAKYGESPSRGHPSPTSPVGQCLPPSLPCRGGCWLCPCITELMVPFSSVVGAGVLPGAGGIPGVGGVVPGVGVVPGAGGEVMAGLGPGAQGGVTSPHPAPLTLSRYPGSRRGGSSSSSSEGSGKGRSYR